MRDGRTVITIDTKGIIQRRFGGIGFQIFHTMFPHRKSAKAHRVIRERWLELKPSFARVGEKLPAWNDAQMQRFAEALQVTKETETELYLTTWNPPVLKPGKERARYAADVAKKLAFLTRERGLTNIAYYCMSNELTFKGTWNKLAGEMETLKDYHAELHKAFLSHGLKVELLAPDSVLSYKTGLSSVRWATEHMDGISGAYGGHSYIKHKLDDLGFYDHWLEHMKAPVALARGKKKPFVLGEFGTGSGQKKASPLTIKHCKYNETPKEPLVGIQLAEGAIGAMNAGVYATAYWSFMDAPPQPFYNLKEKTGWPYDLQWGSLRWGKDDFSTRSYYYANGLMTRFFRGPAEVHKVECSSKLLRIAAIQNTESRTWSIAIVNRNEKSTPLTLRMAGAASSVQFDKYVYDPARVPQDASGRLPRPAKTVSVSNGVLEDSVGPGRLVIYTSVSRANVDAHERQGRNVGGQDGLRHRGAGAL
jgi:hypothetical protein